MKRIISIILCLIMVLSFGLLTGCNNAKGKESSKGINLTGIQDNEILTYDKIDSSKTVISVARSGNVYVKFLCEAFMKNNPDVQIVYLDITGGNGVVRPFLDWFDNGYRPILQ